MYSTINLQILDYYIEEHDLSIRQTAKKMGISHCYLVQVLNKKRIGGAKFIYGMLKIGFTTEEIFKDPKKDYKKKINITRKVCNYMNSFGAYGSKEYTMEEVRKIRKAVNFEKQDRLTNKIRIDGRTLKGRKNVAERVVKIAKDKLKLKITYKDVLLYKRCSSTEARERKLIGDVNYEKTN